MKRIWKVLTASLAALCMCLPIAACGGSGGGSSKAGAAGFVSFDINPAIEITTDADGKVATVHAGNKDAQILLSDLNLIGLTVEEAAKIVTENAELAGYLSDTNKKVVIMTAAETDAAADELAADAAKGAGEGSDLAKVETNNSKSLAREVERLKTENPDLYKDMTPAKLRLIQALMKYDASMTVEKGAAMQVAELNKMVHAYHEELEDCVTDELEDKFEARYEAAVAELKKQIDAFYGEEYAAKAEIYRKLEAMEERFEDELENAEIAADDVTALVAVLGLTDGEALKNDEGKITAESVEAYLDRIEDEWDEVEGDDEDEAYEEMLDAAEEIVEKYDEDEAALTPAMLAEIAEVAGDTVTVATLEELDDILDTMEDELDEMKDAVKLSKEDKKAVEEIKAQMKEIKKTVKAEMKGEIDAAKAELKELKAAKIK